MPLAQPLHREGRTKRRSASQETCHRPCRRDKHGPGCACGWSERRL